MQRITGYPRALMSSYRYWQEAKSAIEVGIFLWLIVLHFAGTRILSGTLVTTDPELAKIKSMDVRFYSLD